MSKPKWHKGAPPSIGWWPASSSEDLNDIRWWDGKLWSHAVHPIESAKFAAHLAKYKNTRYSSEFKWTERWWL